MKKIILLILAVLALSIASDAKTNWRFYVGGMYNKGFNSTEWLDSYDRPTGFKSSDEIPTAGSYNIMAGMDIQFSIKDRFYIETGLNYRRTPYMRWESMSETDPFSGEVYKWHYIGEDPNTDTERNIISIPVRFGYRLVLNEHNEFQFGIGPYVGADFDNCYYVGLSPVVTYKHRALSLSFRWENPMFLNTSHNYFDNTVAFTVGVNFNGRKPNMDNIIMGMEIANQALSGANNVLGQMYGNSGGSGSYSYDSDSSSSSRSSGSGSSDNGFSVSEQQAYNRDKATYARYDSLLAAYFAGNSQMSVSEKNNMQSNMRRLREKWQARGKGWTKVANETR